MGEREIIKGHEEVWKDNGYADYFDFEGMSTSVCVCMYVYICQNLSNCIF